MHTCIYHTHGPTPGTQNCRKLYTQWETRLHVPQKKLRDLEWPTQLAHSSCGVAREGGGGNHTLFTEAPADISPGAHRPRLDAPLPSALLVPTGIDRNPEAQIAPASERSHRCFGSLRSGCSVLRHTSCPQLRLKPKKEYSGLVVWARATAHA